MRKKYIDFELNQKSGYPVGKDIYYECEICKGIVHSIPEFFDECSCRNIVVDRSGGRLNISSPSQMKVFKSVGAN